MNPRTLLRLYPRAWRARYGDELLEVIGDRPLTVAQTLDIVGGAIDARFLGASFFAMAHGAAPATPTPAVIGRFCSGRANYTTRDGLISAAALVGLTFMFLGIGAVLKQNGWDDQAKFLKNVSFPVSMIMSSNFTFMKGLSALARFVIIGGTVLVIALLGLVTVEL